MLELMRKDIHKINKWVLIKLTVFGMASLENKRCE